MKMSLSRFQPMIEGVSVVIPWGSLKDDVGRAIEGCLRQTVSPEVIFVIANGGVRTDHILKLRNDFLNQPIQFVHVPGCSNANIARNIGVSLVRTKLTAFLDADDWWDLGHLANSISRMIDSNSDMTYAGFIKHMASGLSRVCAKDFRLFGGMENYLLSYYSAQTSTLVARTECLIECLWDVSLNRHQDYDFLARFSEKFTVNHSPCFDVHVDWIAEPHGRVHRDCFVLIKRWESRVDSELYKHHFNTLAKLALRQRSALGLLALPRLLLNLLQDAFR